MELYRQISIRPLSTSGRESHYLLSCGGHHYEANGLVVELLRALQEEPDRESAIERFMRDSGGDRYTPEQVAEAVGRTIDPLLEEQEERKTFLYQRELLSAEAVDRFSDRLGFLFRLPVMLPVLLAGAAADVWFFATAPDLLEFDNYMTLYTAVGLLAFMLLSSFIHELGHASACKHFGVRHGGIGFGLYLNFPVLYTDVSEVWSLGRLRRCVVNVAGVYFQVYCLLALLCVYAATGNDLVRYLVLALNLGFLMTLNPFFKFDGYWLACDLLGVPNLRQCSREWLSYVWKRMRKRPAPKPYLLTINRLERYGLLAYSVVVNVFMGYYFLYVLPKFLFDFVKSFPGEVESLVIYLSNGVAPPFALLRNMGSQLLFLALVVFMAVNVARPLLKRRMANPSKKDNLPSRP